MTRWNWIRGRWVGAILLLGLEGLSGIRSSASEIRVDRPEVEIGSDLSDFSRAALLQPGYLSTLRYNSVSPFNPSQILDNITVTYLGMASSPSLQGISSGQRDSAQLRNFLGVGYRLSEAVTFSGNAFWSVRGVEQFPTQIHDPFLRLADGSFLSGENWNLYVDGRVHLPLSAASVNSGLSWGIQSVQVLTYSVPESRFSIGFSSSIRYNSFKLQGYGSDLDLYWGPSFLYQLAPTLGLNFLSEVLWSHLCHRGGSGWTYPSFDLEPGLAWDVLPSLSLNPYFHFPLGVKSNVYPMYLGLVLSWTLL